MLFHHHSPKPLLWVGSAKKDLQAMPSDVQDTFGYALHFAQTGSKHAQAKPLNLDSSVGRARVGRWRRVWVGATTTHSSCPLGGATPPGALPEVQSGA